MNSYLTHLLTAAGIILMLLINMKIHGKCVNHERVVHKVRPEKVRYREKQPQRTRIKY